MARRKRQLVLSGKPLNGGTVQPLGSLASVFEQLRGFNTGLDGSPDRGTGVRLLHGPGFVVEIPTSLDPVSQAMVTINDEDIALPVLFRFCKSLNWRLTDLETNRSFG